MYDRSLLSIHVHILARKALEMARMDESMSSSPRKRVAGGRSSSSTVTTTVATRIQNKARTQSRERIVSAVNTIMQVLERTRREAKSLIAQSRNLTAAKSRSRLLLHKMLVGPKFGGNPNAINHYNNEVYDAHDDEHYIVSNVNRFRSIINAEGYEIERVGYVTVDDIVLIGGFKTVMDGHVMGTRFIILRTWPLGILNRVIHDSYQEYIEDPAWQSCDKIETLYDEANALNLTAHGTPYRTNQLYLQESNNGAQARPNNATTFNRFLSTVQAFIARNNYAIVTLVVILIAIVGFMLLNRQPLPSSIDVDLANASEQYLTATDPSAAAQPLREAVRTIYQDYVTRRGEAGLQVAGIGPVQMIDDDIFDGRNIVPPGGSGRPPSHKKKRVGGAPIWTDNPRHLNHPPLTQFMKDNFDKNFLPTLEKATDKMTSVPGIGSCGHALLHSALKARDSFMQGLVGQLKMTKKNREDMDANPSKFLWWTTWKVLDSKGSPALQQCAKEAVEWGGKLENGSLTKEEFINKLIASAEHHVQEEVMMKRTVAYHPQKMSPKVLYYIVYALLAVMMAYATSKVVKAIIPRVMRMFPAKVVKVHNANNNTNNTNRKKKVTSIL
jgi:hypothetical protein